MRFSLLTLLFCLLTATPLHASKLVPHKEVQAECVVLINANTGRVLWEKNPDDVCFTASTSKIATVFYALMQKPHSLQEKIVAPREVLVTVSPSEKMRANYSKCPSYWMETDGTHVGIKTDERMTFEDLLYATMLASGNDSANVIAHYVGGGSIPRFMDGMNCCLKQLGCEKTHFCNPHGLHHPEHVTTARDMARLAQCAMYHPLFRKIVRTQSYERKATNKQPKTVYAQHNKLIHPGRYFYPYAIGIKTGYTSKAKHTIVAAAEKDGRLLIASLMRCKDRSSRFQDAETLFEAAFSEQKMVKTLMAAGDQQFSRAVAGGKAALTTYTKEPLEISYYLSEEPELHCELVWESISLPIQEGEPVGRIRLLADNAEIQAVPLFAKNSVDEVWFAGLWRAVTTYWILVLVIIAAALGAFIFRRSTR